MFGCLNEFRIKIDLIFVTITSNMFIFRQKFYYYEPSKNLLTIDNFNV